MSDKSDGSTASYYELPEGCTELQHLISYRNLNAQDGEMFRAIYRKGRASHSDELRDARKVLFYAKAEVERLERYASGCTDLKINIDGEMSDELIDALDSAKPAWAEGERMDIIARNGNDGEHYAEDMSDPANWRDGDLVCFYGEPKGFFTPTRIYTLRDSGSTEELKTVDDDDHPHFISFPHARENFRFHSRPSSGGWIEWPGGECPCDELSEVEVQTRGGYTRSGKAGSFLWRHVAGSCGDIIRYRML